MIRVGEDPLCRVTHEWFEVTPVEKEITTREKHNSPVSFLLIRNFTEVTFLLQNTSNSQIVYEL